MTTAKPSPTQPDLPMAFEPVLELEENAPWLMPCGPVRKPAPWRTDWLARLKAWAGGYFDFLESVDPR